MEVEASGNGASGTGRRVEGEVRFPKASALEPTQSPWACYTCRGLLHLQVSVPVSRFTPPHYRTPLFFLFKNLPPPFPPWCRLLPQNPHSAPTLVTVLRAPLQLTRPTNPFLRKSHTPCVCGYPLAASLSYLYVHLEPRRQAAPQLDTQAQPNEGGHRAVSHGGRELHTVVWGQGMGREEEERREAEGLGRREGLRGWERGVGRDVGRGGGKVSRGIVARWGADVKRSGMACLLQRVGSRL